MENSPSSVLGKTVVLALVTVTTCWEMGRKPHPDGDLLLEQRRAALALQEARRPMLNRKGRVLA